MWLHRTCGLLLILAGLFTTGALTMLAVSKSDDGSAFTLQFGMPGLLLLFPLGALALGLGSLLCRKPPVTQASRRQRGAVLASNLH